MKSIDVQKLPDAGLISDELRQNVIERFNLKADSHRFDIIVSSTVSDLVAAGIDLLSPLAWPKRRLVVSWGFLKISAVYLEKMRRAPMKQIKSPGGLRPEAKQI